MQKDEFFATETPREATKRTDVLGGRERNLSLPETNIQTLSFMGKKLPTSLNW